MHSEMTAPPEWLWASSPSCSQQFQSCPELPTCPVVYCNAPCRTLTEAQWGGNLLSRSPTRAVFRPDGDGGPLHLPPLYGQKQCLEGPHWTCPERGGSVSACLCGALSLPRKHTLFPVKSECPWYPLRLRGNCAVWVAPPYRGAVCRAYK